MKCSLVLVFLMPAYFLLISGCRSEKPAATIMVEQTNTSNCLTSDPKAMSIPAGEGLVGANHAYPEERPERKVKIAAFDIDSTEIRRTGVT